MITLPEARLLVLFCATVSLLPAQHVPVPVPHRPVPSRLPDLKQSPKPATARSMVGGPWMIDANFRSVLHIRNDVRTAAITVTPVLYLSNGKSYPLLPVQLSAGGSVSLNLNDMLQQQGIAGWATLSGYVELQYQWPWDALCATIQNLDAVHSELFNFSLMPGPSSLDSSEQATDIHLEGMWWKQEPGVTGFLSLSNVKTAAMDAQVQVTDAAGQSIKEYALSIPSHATTTMRLFDAADSLAQAGGVQVSFSGSQADLIVNGGLEDQRTGYSANLGFSQLPMGSGSQLSHYAAVGVMTGAADPMMHFPAGTVFTPYLVARNLAQQAVTLRPMLYWMQAGAPHSYAAPSQSMAPRTTRNLDVRGLLNAAGLADFNGSVNFEFDITGPAHSVLLTAGSVDRKNTYVFSVAVAAVKESLAKELSRWSTANGDDTMVTVWNPADEAQDFAFTLFYPGGQYVLPIHLEAKATRSFDISEVIAGGVPDAGGSVVPLSIQEGSAELSGSRGEVEHILAVFDAGTYNVQKATCGLYCQTCQGATNWWIVDDPFAVPLANSHQLTMHVQYHTGTQYDHTQSSSWSSSNTSIATVSSGLVQGISAGAATAYAENDSEPIYSNTCQGLVIDCPLNSGVQAQSPGMVPVLSCSPAPVTRGQTVTCTIQGGSGVQGSNWTFSGSDGHSVSGPSNATSWSGVVAISGTVSATANYNGATANLQASISVTPRSPLTVAMPPMPSTPAANGTPPMPALTSPPSGAEGTYGQSAYAYVWSFTSAAINSGPNTGYSYISTLTDTSKYIYELNPGLTNPQDPFYTHQYGRCGIPSVSQIVSAVQTHEYAGNPSHYSEIAAALSSNNPGVTAEAVVALTSDIRNVATQKIQPVYDAAVHAGDVEPPTNLPPNINIPPYQPCP